MIHLPDVTLCAIDTRTPELAVAALQASSSGLAFARTMLLSDRPVQPMPAAVELVRTGPIASAADYSMFVLTKLLDHVQTPFVLIVQWDGYVIEPAAWRPEFLDWDYIGAPWQYAPPGLEVGNGGFSLRSRRLLEVLRQDPEIQLHHPEDWCICRTNAKRLVDHAGIRFAPQAVARQFAFEAAPVTPRPFGFHGSYNMPYLLDEPRLREWLAKLPDELLAGRDGWKTVKRLMHCGHMELARQTLARHRRGGRAHIKAAAMAAWLALRRA